MPSRKRLLHASGVDDGPFIPVRRESGTDLVSIASINWIEAHGDYVNLHTSVPVTGTSQAAMPNTAISNSSTSFHYETFELRQTMTELAEILPAEDFVRVHRSYLVRITRVNAIRPAMRGSYELTMQDGSKLPTGRTFRDVVRETFRVA